MSHVHQAQLSYGVISNSRLHRMARWSSADFPLTASSVLCVCPQVQVHSVMSMIVFDYSPQIPCTYHTCVCPQVQVHQGFLSAYDSIKGTLLKLLDSATAEGARGVHTGDTEVGYVSCAHVSAHGMCMCAWFRGWERKGGLRQGGVCSICISFCRAHVIRDQAM